MGVKENRKFIINIFEYFSFRGYVRGRIFDSEKLRNVFRTF